MKVEMHDAHGAVLHTPAEPITYLHGGYGGLLEALEQALEGKAAGDEVQVQLEPEQAYGEYDADRVDVRPVERYGEGLVVGMEIEEGSGAFYRVTDIAGGSVVLDGNHPLAGMALRFYLRVVEVRAAKPEEISRGVSLP